MARFHFITNWVVQASEAEVYQIIKDTDHLTDWWPSVYLQVHTIENGNALGLGKKVDLYTKGFLPYTLSWRFEVTDVIPNQRLALRAYGDLNGTGVWLFSQIGKTCYIRYDWDITFEKAFLSRFVWLLRPLFEFNHKWAMAKGLDSLKQELLKRRGLVTNLVPPQPTFV
jgi:hypothetical protein